MFIVKSLVILAVAFNLTSAAKLPQPGDEFNKDVDFIDYYDCSAKANGNYYHPWDCTKFITCSNGYASERDCAACNPGDPRCPEGRTNFDEPSDACLWPDLARCTGGPRPTDAPVTDDPNACDPDCNEEGNCKSFRRCEKNENGAGGHWVNEQCSEGLWWNNAGEPGRLHGGQCTSWSELSAELKQKYQADEQCIPPTTTTTTTTTTPAPEECDWYEIGACSDGYIYNHPERTDGKNVTLTCNDGTRWNHAAKTCDHCWNVNDADGEPCCPAPEVPAEDIKEIFTCEGLKDGIYKNVRDCKSFWKCLNGNPAKISCPASEVFNPALLVCEPEELSSNLCDGVKI